MTALRRLPEPSAQSVVADRPEPDTQRGRTNGSFGRRADAGDDAPDRLARRLDAVRRRFSLSDRYGSITGPRSQDPIGARKNRDDTRSAHREASVRDLIANLGVTEDNPDAAATEPERSAPRTKDCAAQLHHPSRRRLNAGRRSRTGARAKRSLFSRTDPWPAREQARPERLTDVRLGRHYPPQKAATSEPRTCPIRASISAPPNSWHVACPHGLSSG